jgi:tetratricopeptide (TPR) repeat protein
MDNSLAGQLSGTGQRGRSKKGKNRLLLAAILFTILASFAILALIALTVVDQRNALPDSAAERNIITAEAQVKADPKSPEARVAVAKAYLAAENYDSAMAYVNQALSLDKNFSKAYLLRGDIRRAEGDVGQARKDYEQTLKIDEYAVDARIALAEMEQAAGRPKEAIKHLDTAIEAASQDASLYLARGKVYLQLNNKEEARKSMAKAVALLPDLKEAETALEQMNYGPAYYDLAQLAWTRNEPEKAKALMEQATEVSPEIAWLQIALGDFRALQGDKAGARVAYEQALTLDPESKEAKDGLAELE